MNSKLFSLCLCLPLCACQPSLPSGNEPLVRQAPKQEAITPLPLEKNGTTLTAVARYSIEALILGREDYAWDEGSDISPIDLALGWQDMSNPAVVSQIEISQGSRFYRWHVSSFPIPRHHIESQSANVHLIPSSSEIAQQLQGLEKGQHIALEGFLVNAQKGNRTWRTSLSRTDTGAGACELIWVTELSLYPTK